MKKKTYKPTLSVLNDLIEIQLLSVEPKQRLYELQGKQG